MKMKDIPKVFPKRMRQLRAETKCSKSFLGSFIGVSGAAVDWWEQGKTFPKPERLVALAEVFDTTVAYLTGESDERKARHRESVLT